MSVALENFSEAARYSEEEHIFYTAIFKKYCKQEMSTMDPKSAGDVLKGLGLVSKQLSQFWVASVGSSSSVTLDMFKLFCKYCSVFENQLPMTAENFARPSKPIVFKNNAETQKVGETAVRDHMQSLQSQPQAAPTRNMPSTMINPDPYSPNPNNVPTPKPYQPPQSNMGGFQEDITARPQMNSMGYSQQQSTKPSEPSTRPGVNIFEQNPNGFLSRTGSNDTSFTSTTSGDRQDMGQNSYPRPSQPQGQANPLSSNTGSDPYKITIAEFQELVLLIDGIRNQEPGFYTKVDLKDALIGSKAPRANLKTAWEMFDTPAQNKIKREAAISMIWLLRLNGRGIELPSAIPVAFQKYLTSNQYPYQSSEPMQLRLNDQTFMTDLEFKKQYSSIESRFREIQPKNAEHFEEYSKNNTQILERARKEARDLKLQVENIRLLKKLISSDNENLRAEAEDLKRIVQSSNVSKDVRNFLEDAKSKQENSTRKITAAFLGASNFVRDSKEKDQLMAAVRDENTRLLHNNEQLMRKNKDLEDQQLNSNFNTVPKEVVVTAPTKNIDLDSGNQAPVNQAPQQVSLQAKEPSEEEDDFFGDNDAHRNTNPVVHQNDDDEFFLDKTEAPANNNAAFSEPFDPTKRDDLNLPQQPGAYTKAEDLITTNAPLNHNFEETDRRIMGIQTGKPNPNEEIDDFFD